MTANASPMLPPRLTSRAPAPARLLEALDAGPSCHPPRPPGFAACVAWLQQDPAQLAGRPIAMRSLQTLRTSLFSAPGRDAEMALLWREALASACHARVVATHMQFDARLLTGAALLHRVGEVVALRALARAENACGERLAARALHTTLERRSEALLAHVTHSWSLPGELRLTLRRWRHEQDNPQRPRCVTLLIMVQALATGLVHATTCTPGLVQAAREALNLPASLVDVTDAATPGIDALIAATERPDHQP